MELPESTKQELARWNNGKGIDLESWVYCEGRFALAVGYSAIFWPEFVQFESYILRKGFSESSLREFEKQNGATPKSVEWVMNHLHIADIQHSECADLSRDKIVFLGNILKEIYELKLSSLFPHSPCEVEFYIPEDKDDLTDYQISFWQKAHN